MTGKHIQQNCRPLRFIHQYYPNQLCMDTTVQFNELIPHVSGVTNVGGMCQFPSSASICEDNGLMVGKTLAHETGHS